MNSTLITIQLNGQFHQTHHTTLQQLVESLTLTGKRFAVEQNQQLIPKSRLADTPLNAGDQIEIIQAVGGG